MRGKIYHVIFKKYHNISHILIPLAGNTAYTARNSTTFVEKDTETTYCTTGHSGKLRCEESLHTDPVEAALRMVQDSIKRHYNASQEIMVKTISPLNSHAATRTPLQLKCPWGISREDVCESLQGGMIQDSI